MVGTMYSISRLIRQSVAFLGLFLLLLSGTVQAASEEQGPAFLDREIAEIKAEVAALSQTLFELEESVLHPSDTQVAVFLAQKEKEGLALDSVEIYLNDSPVSSLFIPIVSANPSAKAAFSDFTSAIYPMAATS